MPSCKAAAPWSHRSSRHRGPREPPRSHHGSRLPLPHLQIPLPQAPRCCARPAASRAPCGAFLIVGRGCPSAPVLSPETPNLSMASCLVSLHRRCRPWPRARSPQLHRARSHVHLACFSHGRNRPSPMRPGSPLPQRRDQLQSRPQIAIQLSYPTALDEQSRRQIARPAA